MKIPNKLFSRLVSIGAAITLLVSVFVVVPTTSAFSGVGSGIDTDEYIITTCAQLQEMNDDLSAYYKLGNDIDCSATSTWNSGAGFVPIGTLSDSFTGTLLGDGRTIKGLTIDRPSTDYVGLFGSLYNASVLRFALRDVAVTGRDHTASVAGYIINADIYEVSVWGDVTGMWWTGGINGQNSGHVMNSFSRADVHSPASRIGGAVGENNGVIFNTYATGEVETGAGATGGLVGFEDAGITTDSYWDTETTGQATSAQGTGKTTLQMQDTATYTDTTSDGVTIPWDFVGNPYEDGENYDIWNREDGKNGGYPYLVAQGYPAPDLSTSTITQQDINGGYLLAGDTLRYTITITNTGEVGATGIEATGSFSWDNPWNSNSFGFEVDASNCGNSWSDNSIPIVLNVTDIKVPVGQSCVLTFTKTLRNDVSYPASAYQTVNISSALEGGSGANSISTTHLDVTNPIHIDSDGDGAQDVIENAGPNGGDANDDGIPDSGQANVFSALNYFTGDYQVLETDCDAIYNILTADPYYLHDQDYTYPMGLNDFQVECPESGMTAHVAMYNYGVEFNPNYVMRKQTYDGHYIYSTIDGYQLSNPTISGGSVTKVEYDLTEGGPLDLDPNPEDGLIYDPAGLGLPVASSQSSSPNGGSSSGSGDSNSNNLAGTGQSVQLLVLGGIILVAGSGTILYKRKR